jgi:hypothetical protein
MAKQASNLDCLLCQYFDNEDLTLVIEMLSQTVPDLSLRGEKGNSGSKRTLFLERPPQVEQLQEGAQ